MSPLLRHMGGQMFISFTKVGEPIQSILLNIDIATDNYFI